MRHRLFITLCLLALLSACAAPRQSVPTRNMALTAGSKVEVSLGDTLYSFARRNHASMREIIDLNGLQAPYILTPGMQLTLPADTQKPLPSVELGAAAYANEEAYQQKHARSPITLYQQVVPERITDTPTQDRTIYAPVPAPKSLQTIADEQVDKQKLAQKMPLASSLNLPPLEFDKEKKQLKAPPVTKKTAPKPPVKEAVNKEEIGKPPQLNPQKKTEALHSRIENAQEPVNLIWPVQGQVLSTFGPKSNGLSNDGINIGAPRSTPVVAADGGTVAYSGSDIPGFGNVILLRHANGLMTTYAHLERMFVQKDIVVAKGDLLGTVGTSGGLDTPQLHFEIRRDKQALDPSKYLYR